MVAKSSRSPGPGDMRFTHISGATGVLEHEGRRLLLDPWLDDGIFHGSWFHYPPAEVSIDSLGSVDYVFISHIHEDHCSPGTIAHLNRNAELIIADRNPNFVLGFLQRQGFDFAAVHLVRPHEPREIAPGMRADIVTADPAHELNYLIDSALILDWAGTVVYDANDCPPYPAGLDYIRKHYPRVDLALLPYATGSSYPACYANLTTEEKERERERLLDGAMNAFVDNVRELAPRRVAPFADQYVVGGSRSHLNRFIPHPPGIGQVRDRLVESGLGELGVFLNSGQTIDLESGEISPDEPYRAVTDVDRERYIANHLAGATYDHERFTLSRTVPLGRLVELARERLWTEQQRRGWYPRLSIALEALDWRKRWLFGLDEPGVAEQSIEDTPSEPFLRIGMPSTLLSMLLIGHVSWNIADAALFLDLERVPNVYDPAVHAALNYLRI